MMSIYKLSGFNMAAEVSCEILSWTPLQIGGIYVFKMPLIIMCGFPCSGKSKRAQELRNYLENRGKTVYLASDESSSLDRNTVYSGIIS